MNQIITRAQTAVDALAEATSRLSAVTVTETTRMCGDASANSEFTRLVSAAETAVETAMDEVDGPALTEFDYALDALRTARQDFFVPTDANRVNANDHAQRAKRHIAQGIAKR